MHVVNYKNTRVEDKLRYELILANHLAKYVFSSQLIDDHRSLVKRLQATFTELSTEELTQLFRECLVTKFKVDCYPISSNRDVLTLMWISQQNDRPLPTELMEKIAHMTKHLSK